MRSYCHFKQTPERSEGKNHLDADRGPAEKPARARAPEQESILCICIQLGEGGQRWGPRAHRRSSGADPVSMDLAFTVHLPCARHVHPDPMVSAERHREGQRAQPRPPEMTPELARTAVK